MRCKACHYSLKELTEPRCPECGRAFDPNDPETFRPDTLPPVRHRTIIEVAALVFVLMVIMGFLDGVNAPADEWFYTSSWLIRFRVVGFAFLHTVAIVVVVVVPCVLLINAFRRRANRSVS